MPFPARKCGDFLFVDGIISVPIPVSIQALVPAPVLMPVLMLTAVPAPEVFGNYRSRFDRRSGLCLPGARFVFAR